jgi:hypothetical protein
MVDTTTIAAERFHNLVFTIHPIAITAWVSTFWTQETKLREQNLLSSGFIKS